MTYKAFTIRSANQSWDKDAGYQVFLQGGFYQYDLAKTFKNTKVVVLCENLPSKKVQNAYGSEFWFVQSTKQHQEKVVKLVEDKTHDFEQPELIIQGRGKIVNSLTAHMGCSPD